MNFFDEASLRLKQALKVTADKDAAEAIGLSPSAWKQRKTRGVFPMKEVYALAAQRPELQLDADWVITGATARMTTKSKAEAGLLQAFRVMSEDDRNKTLNILYVISGINNMSAEEMQSRFEAYDQSLIEEDRAWRGKFEPGKAA